MAASKKHPEYKMNLYDSSGTKYQLKNATTDLVFSHGTEDIAEKVTITIANVMVGKKRLSSHIKLRQKVYLYANTGSGYKEVFRGYVWERKFSTTSEVREITLLCYDRLIYLQKSKDNLFRKKGSQTKDVITALAKKWGIKIRYNYKSITHGKLVYRSEYISDILISILNKVKKKTGVGYVIRCEKGVMVIESQGSNKTVHKVEKGDNSISDSYVQSMEDMITKVKIVKAETVKKKKKKKSNKTDSETDSKTDSSKTDSEKTSSSKSSSSDYTEEETGRYITIASVKGDTKKYGTLQDIVEKGSDDKLSEAKKEAKNIIKKNGKPSTEISVTGVDNPLIKKGHKVYINTGVLKNNYIVKGIEHDAASHTMTLEVKKA